MENELFVDDLKELINVVEIHTVTVYPENAELRDRFGLNMYVDGLKLYFEACIWSELYPIEKKIAGFTAETTGGFQVGLLNISGRLMRRGLQIGLINMASEGGAMQFMPIINGLF